MEPVKLSLSPRSRFPDSGRSEQFGGCFWQALPREEPINQIRKHDGAIHQIFLQALRPTLGLGFSSGDQTHLAFMEPVVPDPVEHNDDPIAKPYQIIEVQEQPDQPGEVTLEI